MEILDGNLVSAHIKAQIKQEVIDWQAKGGKKPHLAAILVGNNPASEAYVGNKVRTCEELGFESTLLRFTTDITEFQLIHEVNLLNQNDSVDGILVQLPLPKHINPDSVSIPSTQTKMWMAFTRSRRARCCWAILPSCLPLPMVSS